MIIDLILDRKETGVYDPHDFYRGVMTYRNVTPHLADTIASAMDSGTNEDVQDALCEYIDCNGYAESVKKYILSKDWI